MMDKGQTQTLTTVMITTVTIGAIAAGYTWGTPLLEKRQGQASINNVERDALGVYSAINTVADSGQGSTRTVSVNPQEGSVAVNETLDYIEIKTTGENPPYPQSVWKLLRGNRMQNVSMGPNSGAYGIEGEDSSGVVGVRTSSGAQQTIRYRIEFRNIRTDNGLERVDLKTVGGSRASGQVDILVRNTGNEVDNDYEAGGDLFSRYRTVVEVDLG